MLVKTCIVTITHLLIGIAIFLPNSVQANEYFDLTNKNFDFGPCTGDPSACFQLTIDRLKQFPTEWRFKPTPQGTRVVSTGIQTPIVALFIHGLYGSSEQFDGEQRIFAKNGINSVSTTLPGHAPFAQDHDQLDFNKWLKHVEKEFDLAKRLGKKVALIGQSTGATLATYLALKYPEQVSGLILYEAAFEVESTLRWATCGLKDLFPTAQDLGIFGKLYDSNLDRYQTPISLNLGCQVSRLTSHLLESFGREPRNSEASYEVLFKKIQVPTLIFAAPNDNIVNTKKLQDLAAINKNVQLKMMSKINGKRYTIEESKHGYSQKNSYYALWCYFDRRALSNASCIGDMEPGKEMEAQLPKIFFDKENSEFYNIYFPHFYIYNELLTLKRNIPLIREALAKLEDYKTDCDQNIHFEKNNHLQSFLNFAETFDAAYTHDLEKSRIQQSCYFFHRNNRSLCSKLKDCQNVIFPNRVIFGIEGSLSRAWKQQKPPMVERNFYGKDFFEAIVNGLKALPKDPNLHKCLDFMENAPFLSKEKLLKLQPKNL